MPKKIVAAKSILKRNSSLLKTQFFIVLTYCADPFYIGYRKVISIFDLSLRDFLHRVKSIQIRSFFWSVISCIQTEYGDLLHKFLNQSEYRKIWIRKDSVFGHFAQCYFQFSTFMRICLKNIFLFSFIFFRSYPLYVASWSSTFQYRQ